MSTAWSAGRNRTSGTGGAGASYLVPRTVLRLVFIRFIHGCGSGESMHLVTSSRKQAAGGISALKRDI